MTQAELSLPARRATIAEWLTVERAAYGVITLLAVGLRAHDLAARTLLPSEAAQALPAWQSAGGLPHNLAGLSPLLFNLQRLLMIPFGGGDALARWPLVLFGGLAPLLFWALRDRLGRGGALAAAVLWAFSPLAVFFSRAGLAYGLVPPLALALLAALNLYFRDGGRRSLLWAGVALGMLLAAGPGAYTVVLIGVLAALLWRSAWQDLAQGVRANPRPVALAVAGALVLSATGFLITWPGLALAVDQLGRWFRQLLPGGGPSGFNAAYTAPELLVRLVISEPLLLIAGTAGVILAWRRANAFGLMTGLAALVALVIPLAGPGRHPGDLDLVVLALVLLAGPVVAAVLADLAAWGRDVDPWLLGGLSLALLIAAGISVPSAFNAVPESSRRLFIAVGLIALFLCLGLWVVFSLWGSWAVVRRTLPVLGLLLGSAWGIGQLSGLNYDRSVGRESGVLAQLAGPGWADVHGELLNLSPQYGTGRDEAPVDVLVSSADDPLATMLAWELKDHPHLRVVTSLPANPAPLVITPMPPGAKPGDQVAGVPPSYSGLQVDLLDTWRPAELPDAYAWLRWVLYREAPAPTQVRTAVLWANRSITQPLSPLAVPQAQ